MRAGDHAVDVFLAEERHCVGLPDGAGRAPDKWKTRHFSGYGGHARAGRCAIATWGAKKSINENNCLHQSPGAARRGAAAGARPAFAAAEAG
ncbi:hypothetical protein ACX84U_21700, partial [Burkholderia pseudomallei]